MLLLGAVTCGTRQVSAIKRLAVGVTRGVGVGDALGVGIAIRRDTLGVGRCGLPNSAEKEHGQWIHLTGSRFGRWKGLTQC